MIFILPKETWLDFTIHLGELASGFTPIFEYFIVWNSVNQKTCSYTLNVQNQNVNNEILLYCIKFYYFFY